MSIQGSTGKAAILGYFTKSALVVGDGVAALTGDTWYLINSKKAVGTALPAALRVGDRFKTPVAATVVTPAIGDDVYKLTHVRICKVNVNFDASKGAVDITDDCDSVELPDGIVKISGSVTGFEKHNDPEGGLTAAQTVFHKKFWDFVTDSGVNVYTLAEFNNDQVELAVLVNSAYTATGTIQTWIMMPANILTFKSSKDNSSGQSFDFTFSKGEGNAVIYERVTNATETVI